MSDLLLYYLNWESARKDSLRDSDLFHPVSTETPYVKTLIPIREDQLGLTRAVDPWYSGLLAWFKRRRPTKSGLREQQSQWNPIAWKRKGWD